MLTLYRVGAKRQRELMDLAREARQTRRTGWWQEYSDLPRDYAAFEADAASIRLYSASLVPGLLQTRDYAQAVLGVIGARRPKEEIDHRLAFRMARQRVFRERSPQLTAIIDEAALRRLVGGRRVMREQIDWLITASKLANVTLRALPFDVGAHVAMDGAFNILKFADSGYPSIVYLESATSESYIDDDDTIRQYDQLFDQLWDTSLADDEATAAFLTKVAKEI
jgi:hypothetical protein